MVLGRRPCLVKTPLLLSNEFQLGCSLYCEIEASPEQLRVSCGYRLAEPLPRLANIHQDGLNEIEDQPRLMRVDNHRRCSTAHHDAALGLHSMKTIAYSTVVASEPVRVAKIAADVQSLA